MKLIPVLLLAILWIAMTYFYVDIWSQYASFAEWEIWKIQWVDNVDCKMPLFKRKIDCVISTTTWSVAEVSEQLSCAN